MLWLAELMPHYHPCAENIALHFYFYLFDSEFCHMFTRNVKSFAIAIIFYFFFFSGANLHGLVKVVSLFFSIVALVACDQYWTYQNGMANSYV